MSRRPGFLRMVSDILPAGAKAILGVDSPLNLQKINSDLVEVMIEGGVPQHFRRIGDGGLRHERGEKKHANNCIFHSRIVASN
jgi:hypothetical protein